MVAVGLLGWRWGGSTSAPRADRHGHNQSLAHAPPSAPPSPPGGCGLPVASEAQGEMHLARRLPGPRAAGRRGGWAMAFAVLASLVCPFE